MTDLRIRRGDTTTIAIAALQADGVTPQSLTGHTLRFTAKDRRSDLDNAAVISKSTPASGIAITNAAGGLATVTIDPADTVGFATPRTLVWDIQTTDAQGAVKTLDEGLLYVLPDVTRTAP